MRLAKNPPPKNINKKENIAKDSGTGFPSSPPHALLLYPFYRISGQPGSVQENKKGRGRSHALQGSSALFPGSEHP